jgi:hypothetical protein
MACAASGPSSAPAPLAAPSSLEAIPLVAPPPKTSEGVYTGPLWTLCPDKPNTFCLTLPQAKEIRLRYSKALASSAGVAVDEREKREKADARLDASEAARAKGVAVGVAVGVGAFLIGILTGGLIGHFAF